MKEHILQDIENQWEEGYVVYTIEIHTINGSSIYGEYYFDTLEEVIAFFTNEYNDDLVRETHNTQILSWEVKV